MDRTNTQLTADGLCYEELGQYLHPGPYDPVDGLLRAFTRSHVSTNSHTDPAKEGLVKTFRLGGVGDQLHMAVIWSGGAILKADIVPSKPLPSSVVLHPQSWQSNASWRAHLMLNPPADNYVVIIFDKSTDYLRRLRISTAALHIECTSVTKIYRREFIKTALSVFERVDYTVIRDAKVLLDRRMRYPEDAVSIDRRLNELAAKAKFDALAAFLDLLDTVPGVFEHEFDAARMITNVRKKAQQKLQDLAQ